MIELKFVCIILIGVLAHSCRSNEIPDERYVKYKSAQDEISHEQLLARLNKIARQKNMMPYEIVNLLKSSKDKDKPNVILDEFSVNDLLQLNQFSLGKCHENVFSGREAICEKFKKRHQPLFEYCNKMNLELSFWCIAKMDQVHRRMLTSRGFTKEMLDQVLDLKRRVRRSSVIRDYIRSSRILGNLDRMDYVRAIRRVFDNRGQKYEAETRATCTRLVETMCEYLNVPTDIEFHKSYQINFHINTVMLPFQLCLLAVNLEQLEKMASSASEPELGK